MNSPPEIILKGGRANVGEVTRIGDQVARPSYEQTPFVEDFLRHLRSRGIHEAPKPLPGDRRGRQRLTYLPGVAPTPPYPDWAFSVELLVQVAELQRRLHLAAGDYEPPDDAVWAVSAGDYFPHSALQADELVACHNDLGMTNVIVDDEHRLCGVIDFDYSRPVDPLFDIAVAIRHWAPFGDLDLAEHRDESIDRVSRFAAFCDVHELDVGARRRVLELAIDFLDQARTNVVALAEQGGIGFQRLLDEGYDETNRATVRWIRENAATLGHA